MARYLRLVMVACGTGSAFRSITLSSMRTWIGIRRSSTSVIRSAWPSCGTIARPRLTDDRLQTTKSPACFVVTIWLPLMISCMSLVGLMFCRISVHRLDEYTMPACLFGFFRLTSSR